MAFFEDEMRVCYCDGKTPLIWTFKFDGKEYWCPRCGYTSGMLGAGKWAKTTPELLESLRVWTEKALPYLRDETDVYEYTADKD